ncbi:MAG: acylphosphatase [Chloroflexia bacterium]|nr:acylphosphatase [Chloroflexia bacterium]
MICRGGLTFDYGIFAAVQYQVVENHSSPSTSDTQQQVPKLETLRATVRGRVQNVGFRMFALDVARGLNVAGYVRNEYDGSVSVLAVGSRIALEQLLAALRRGPAHARVEHVEVDWLPGNPQGVGAQFEVRAR